MQRLDTRDEQVSTPVVARVLVPVSGARNSLPRKAETGSGGSQKQWWITPAPRLMTLPSMGLICRSANESGQQNDNHCPERRRRNTVRDLTSKAQIAPKLLQQSATDERAD